MRSSSAVVAAVSLPAVAAAAATAAVLWIVGAALVLVLVLGAAVAVLVAAWFRLTAARSALRALRARPARLGDSPRLENLIEGLCTTHGFYEPAVHTVDSAAINAAAVGLGGPRDHLVVTSGALVGLDRLELEAVVARQLYEIRRGVDSATVLAGVARLPGASLVAARLRERTVDRRSVYEADVEAVRITGYPPALAAALRKSAAAPSVDAASAAAHLWLVPPERAEPRGRVQPSTVSRIDVLGEV